MTQEKTTKNHDRTNDRLFTSEVYLKTKDGLVCLHCNHPRHTIHSNGRPRKLYLRYFEKKNCLNCEHLYKSPVV